MHAARSLIEMQQTFEAPRPRAAGAPAAPLVSVVIPTRNGATRLPSVLDALSKQTLQGAFEVIVIDDHSTDSTAEVAASYPFVRVVRNDGAAGVPGASNVGVRAAAAEVIAFTDDDTMPAENWIEHGLELLGATAADAVAGHIDVPLGPHPTLTELMDLGRGYLDQEHYVSCGYFATANLWMRRELFDRIGGFDERFTAQSHDSDLGARIAEAGLRVIYAADLVVEHPPRSRPRQLARKEYRLAMGDVQLRAFSVGARRSQQLHWMLPGYYRPWARIWGAKRIEARGYRLGFVRRVGLLAIQYSCVQLPAVAGSVKATVRHRHALRRRDP